jgi:uncharacterized protein Yka (UPF0111/DUF47 family)
VAKSVSGLWYIMIRGYQAFSGVTLVATFDGSTPDGVTVLLNGVAVTGLSGSAASEKFFKIFGQMTVHILEAAEILGKMLRDPAGDQAPLAAKIKDLEHKGDELTHRVIEELNKTFITPIDREDIHDLSKALDDVLDLSGHPIELLERNPF